MGRPDEQDFFAGTFTGDFCDWWFAWSVGESEDVYKRQMEMQFSRTYIKR